MGGPVGPPKRFGLHPRGSQDKPESQENDSQDDEAPQTESEDKQYCDCPKEQPYEEDSAENPPCE